MGKFALISTIGMGVIALGGLVFSRGKPISLPIASVALVANLFIAGVMAYTAHLGGQIRHTEIRGDATALPAEQEREQEGD